MSFSFDEFIPTYPKQSDPDLQYVINTKKEFIDVSGEPRERRPTPGQLYRHQEAFKRYMIHSDRMLNIQSVGTGKTCAMVSIAEYYKKYKDIENIQKVYILVSGPSIEEEIKRQIACDCTLKDYLNEQVMDSTKAGIYRQKALTRSINQWYKIMTYGKLTKEVLKVGLNSENLDKVYSGSLFLVDEAHYLNDKKSSKQFKEEIGEDMDIDPTAPDNTSLEEQYQVLWKLFHSVKRSKIILSTATPMVNDVKEIADLMNLLLPADMQMSTKWNYDKVTLSQLEPFFRGKVSYVRALETGAEVEYQGTKMNQSYEVEFADEGQIIPFVHSKKDENGNLISDPEQPKVKLSKKTYKSQTIFYPTFMSKFQKEGYQKAEKDAAAFRIAERQASCFIFPDGNYGGNFYYKKKNLKGAGRYIEETRGGYEIIDNTFKKNISSIENLKDYSSKYAFIVENEINAAKARMNGDIVGTSFCYGEFVSGSGLIVLSKILEQYGFDKFNEQSSVFINTSIKTKEFCSSNNFDKIVRPGFTKKLRYAILRPEMTDEQRAALFELFNSVENANGDYCQILLGSRASREGINVFSTLRGYLIDAGWHPAGVHQALSRFVRATSHTYIINLIRKKMISRGEDPALANAKIKIYKLAALTSEFDYEKKIKIDISKVSEYDKFRSIDLDLYDAIEAKDIKIKRMMRFLKQTAFDCPIHYKRNISSSDIDGSDKCDYNVCKYVCYPSELTNNVEPNLMDYSTFEILYSGELINECRDEIIRLISKKNFTTLTEIFEDENIKYIYKDKYVIMALDKIIKDKRTIRNRFGFSSFINTDGNSIFTQAEFPISDSNEDMINNSNLSIYKDSLFGFYRRKLEDITNKLSVSDDADLWNQLLSLPDPLNEDFALFDNIFDKLSNTFQVSKLEEAIISTEDDYLFEAILYKFKKYVYSKKEPLTDILNIKNYLENSSSRRGRTRKQTECPQIDASVIGGLRGEDKDGEIIFLHKLESVLSSSSGFKTNSRFLNPDSIRIYKPSEKDGWRNIYDYECQAYKNLIYIDNENKIKPFLDFEYIGTVLSDKKFRIIDTKKINFENEDKRSTSRGVVCSSFKHTLDLIDILRKSNYLPEDIDEIKVPNIREELVKLLTVNYKINRTKEEIDNYTDEDLIYITKWLSSGVKKNDICKHVQYLFEQENRMYVD